MLSKTNALPVRILLALGLILLIVAQFYFETRASIGGDSTNAAIWNAIYRLEIVNYANVWRALPFLFVGMAIWLVLGNLPKAPKDLHETLSTFDIWSSGAYKIQLIFITILYGFLLIRLYQQSNTVLEPFLWIITLAWLTLLIWNRERKQIDLTPDIRAADLTAILILLTVGIAIGSFALTDLPKQILPDEVHFWVVSRELVLGKIHGSFFDVGVFTFPLATSFFQSWVLQIFGVTFWAWRFSSVVAGVAAIIPLYLLARSWFDRRVAFATGLIFLVNPYFLSFSRFGYNNSQAFFPVTLAIYLWEKGIRKNSLFYLWLGSLAAGLCYYSFFGAWIGVVAIGLSIFYLRLYKPWREIWKLLAILITGFSIMALPRLVFTLSGGKDQALIYKIVESVFINTFYGRYYYPDAELARVYPLIRVVADQYVFFNPQIYWELFVRGVMRTFLGLVDPYLVREYLPVSGLAGLFMPVFLVIGVALALKNWKEYCLGLLLIWFFSGLLFLSILNTFPPHQTHLVVLLPVIALLSALGLIRAMDQIFQQENIRKAALILALSLAAALNLYAFFVTRQVIHPPEFEDYAAWIGQRINQPTTIVYVGATEKMQYFYPLVEANLIPTQNVSLMSHLTANDALGYIHTPTLIFHEGRDENLRDELLRLGFHTQAVYQGQELTGYIFTNTALDLTPDTSPLAELLLFIQSPALIVIGSLLGLLCLLLINERYSIVKLFPT